MKKIVYIINNTGLYGDNVALLNIIDGLLETTEFEIFVVGGDANKKGLLVEQLEKRKVKYSPLKFYFSIYPPINSLRSKILLPYRILKLILLNKIAKCKLQKIITILKPDVIHSNVGPVDIGYQVAKKLRIKHIWHIREYQDLDFGMSPFPSKKAYESKLKSKYNFSIAITKGISDHFKLNTNSKIIYDGVQKSSTAQFLTIKENYFLFVGRIEEAKGIFELIDAFISFSHTNKDYSLKLAGTGVEAITNKLKEKVKNSGISHRVDFLGFRTDIPILMSKATALIVASRCEGFGFITVEAMYNGCLVVGKNTGGTKEILESEDLGILYNETIELTNILNQIATKGINYYFYKINKAQLNAVRNYSTERNLDELIALYKLIIKNEQ